MHYSLSSTLIVIAIVILAIALIAAIIAWKKIQEPGILSNNSNSDISYIKSVLMLFIVLDSVLILVALYALTKIRTSNIGGWIGFIFALIIIILVLIFGIKAINKVDSVAYPWVLRGLVINEIFILLSIFLLITSVFTKPRICTGNAIKKIYQNMKLKAVDCGPCPPPRQLCAPPQPICAPPQQVQQVCAPQPIVQPVCAPPQPVNNCGAYLGANGQIANYVQNPYLPQR